MRRASASASRFERIFVERFLKGRQRRGGGTRLELRLREPDQQRGIRAVRFDRRADTRLTASLAFPCRIERSPSRPYIAPRRRRVGIVAFERAVVEQRPQGQVGVPPALRRVGQVVERLRIDWHFFGGLLKNGFRQIDAPRTTTARDRKASAPRCCRRCRPRPAARRSALLRSTRSPRGCAFSSHTRPSAT